VVSESVHQQIVLDALLAQCNCFRKIDRMFILHQPLAKLVAKEDVVVCLPAVLSTFDFNSSWLLDGFQADVSQLLFG